MRKDEFLRLQSVGKATWAKIADIVTQKKMRIHRLVYNAQHQVEMFEQQLYQEYDQIVFKEIEETYK